MNFFIHFTQFAIVDAKRQWYIVDIPYSLLFFIHSEGGSLDEGAAQKRKSVSGQHDGSRGYRSKPAL
jgi:hypothetical protein